VPQPSSGETRPYFFDAEYPGKSKRIAAGVFALLLGGLGVHKFYLGYMTAGMVMLLVTVFGALFFCVGGVFGPIIISVIALIEGILYLTKSDQEFYNIYQRHSRPWF
jgi:TM2 domain-containing membrane protein YozV